MSAIPCRGCMRRPRAAAGIWSTTCSRPRKSAPLAVGNGATALVNIAAYQGYAAVCDPHGSLLSWTTIEKGGIIVNGAGRRFGDESAGYSGFTPNVMAQGSPCFAIFDQKIFDVAALEEEFVELADYGGIRKADTPAALAKLHGLDAAAIASALENYNRAARGEHPDALGRR